MGISRRSGILVAAALLALAPGILEAGEPTRKVNIVRVPGGGIQPQIVVGDDGAVHMTYFRGDAAAGDVFYVRSGDEGVAFSKPLRANSQEGSVVAIGNIRGPHLALGRGGRVHVAWMGSRKARPQGPGGETPMLYSRLDDKGGRFEAQRNVISRQFGLDGGGSVAADRDGNVYVVWHAPSEGKKGEGHRRVWVTRSSDDGETFSGERLAFEKATGACGCCGIRAFADSRGTLYTLYRSATNVVGRDMYLIASRDQGRRFVGVRIDRWKVATCVMSTSAVAESPAGLLAAWETREQVYYGRIEAYGSAVERSIAAPGGGSRRKHPVVAGNGKGDVILVWTEGMGWNQGGAVAWQVFDRGGSPLPDGAGRKAGVPVWSLVAVFARKDGGFTVIY